MRALRSEERDPIPSNKNYSSEERDLFPFIKKPTSHSSFMERPHAVMIPSPGQSHINPMLQLAKLLHSNGFYITFINTESIQQSILKSEGPDALQGLQDFLFETITNGVVSSGSRTNQQVTKSNMTTYDNCAGPLGDILTRLSNSPGVPRVTCVVYSWLMSFVLDVAMELSIPALVFSTMSACGFMASLHLGELIQRGYTPLKDESYLTNGYLDTPIDWIPGMKDIRLRDLSSFIRTTDGDDLFLNVEKMTAEKSVRAHGLILNTFDFLEADVLKALAAMFNKVYTIGPLVKLLGNITNRHYKLMSLNLWEEDRGYMEWLNSQKPRSVVYVSFGSITTVGIEQLTEFAWGLANSNHPILWVIRPDLVHGDCAILPEDFIEEIKGRSCLASWCSQEEVLSHTSIGGFLTHCGWNSTLESICCGVPMICWPGFAEQHTNARYVCKEWGIGMQIDEDVKREQVSCTVKELMEGERGKEMRKNALQWKDRAKDATVQGGSSYVITERLIEDLNRAKMDPVHPVVPSV